MSFFNFPLFSIRISYPHGIVAVAHQISRTSNGCVAKVLVLMFPRAQPSRLLLGTLPNELGNPEDHKGSKIPRQVSFTSFYSQLQNKLSFRYT